MSLEAWFVLVAVVVGWLVLRQLTSSAPPKQAERADAANGSSKGTGPQQQQYPDPDDEFDRFILALVETSILMDADVGEMLPIIFGTIARVKGEAVAQQWAEKLVALLREGEDRRQASAEDVQRLKHAMAAAHPDLGGPGGTAFKDAHAAWKRAAAALRAQGGRP
jgi:hypothetical protein